MISGELYMYTVPTNCIVYTMCEIHVDKWEYAENFHVQLTVYGRMLRISN
jgi:hypothetical protein